MNGILKYVASRTLRETKWNATLIAGDVVEEVARLKERPGGSLLKVGTGGAEPDAAGAPASLLAVPDHRGERLYDGIDTTHLKLVDVMRLSSGIVGLTYCPKLTAFRDGRTEIVR
jgi:hypothetical protein